MIDLGLGLGLDRLLVFAGLAWTSQTRTPESQLDDTKKFATGDQFKEDIPSVPACGTLQSCGAIDLGFPLVAAGDPNADIVMFCYYRDCKLCVEYLRR